MLQTEREAIESFNRALDGHVDQDTFQTLLDRLTRNVSGLLEIIYSGFEQSVLMSKLGENTALRLLDTATKLKMLNKQHVPHAVEGSPIVAEFKVASLIRLPGGEIMYDCVPVQAQSVPEGGPRPPKTKFWIDACIIRVAAVS